MVLMIALVQVILLIAVLWIWMRFEDLRETVRSLERELDNRAEAIRVLTTRVFKLEGGEPFLPRIPDPPPRPVVPPPEREEPPIFVAPAVEPTVEWETRIGGSLLNKLGVLILVIGIAFFVGYSLTNLGPAGRVALGYLVSVSMLLTGVALERQQIYRAYARGLIGGGWAALYFTTYAVHALPAARLIDSPATGFALLCLVSLAMLGHSLRYRSQVVTGLAFFIAFFTLALWPHLTFAVAAAVPLTAGLLVVAYLFPWTPMALAGVVLSYGAYAIIYNPTPPEFLGVYPTIWILWILFESFDLLDQDRAPLMLPLNCSGLLAVALFTGAKTDIFPLAAGILYALSAAARRRYQTAATISAAFLVWGSYTRLHGLETNVFQLAVAEIAILAGVFLGRRYLVHLGAAVFVLPVLKLVFFDSYNPDWTVCAAIQSALAILNGWLSRPHPLFPSAATLTVAAILYHTMPPDYVAPAWAALALGLFAADLHLNLHGLRYHAYILSAAAFLSMCGGQHLLAPGLVMLACFYSAQFMASREHIVRPAFSILATATLTLLIFWQVSGRMLTIACGFEGIALLAAGFLLRERVLRLSGLTMFFFCIGKLFFWDLSALDTLNRIFSFIILGLLLLGASWAYTRFREQIRRYL